MSRRFASQIAHSSRVDGKNRQQAETESGGAEDLAPMPAKRLERGLAKEGARHFHRRMWGHVLTETLMKGMEFQPMDG
jgi:hypothetical protein